jgi:hypothetical protein
VLCFEYFLFAKYTCLHLLSFIPGAAIVKLMAHMLSLRQEDNDLDCDISASIFADNRVAPNGLFQ